MLSTAVYSPESYRRTFTNPLPASDAHHAWIVAYADGLVIRTTDDLAEAESCAADHQHF